MQTSRIQPQKRSRALLIAFIGEFVIYLSLYCCICFYRRLFPSNLVEGETWLITCLSLFFLPEGLVLLLGIMLRTVALQIGKDERLDLEPETARSKRRLRWFSRLWGASSFLSYPLVTLFAPIFIVGGGAEPLFVLLRNLTRAASHSDYHAWIVLGLLWYLNGLALLPFIQIWKLQTEPDSTYSDEVNGD